MTDLQKTLVEAVGWFHDFCVKENLTYYAIAGTALGAVRHNGFIPWDDDIDVAMPRLDYERLKEISKTFYDENYTIEFPADKKDFVYQYGKVFDKRTTLIEDTRYNTKRGVFIDIFPIDGVGNDFDEASKIFGKIQKRKDIHKLNTMSFRKGRKWYKNGLVVLTRVGMFLYNPQKNLMKIEKLLNKYDYEKSEYLTSIFGIYGSREIMKKEWFGKPKVYKFDGVEIYCPENSDAYLTQMYGDYMKLPPVEKRVTHHSYIYLDLNKSYLD